MSAAERDCTTRYENAHRTVFRELLYPWHPWFGLQVSVHEAIKKADAVVFRCTLSGSDADRWLEVPAWMFERSACPDRARLVSAPFVDGTAIAALTDLVRQALKNRLGSSNAPFSSASTSSHDQNRGEVHDRADVSIHVTAHTSRNDATQQDARPARRGPSQQIDLFGGEQNSAPVEIPAWQELPAEARVKLTDLMARLILDHVQRSRIEPATEAGHDL